LSFFKKKVIGEVEKKAEVDDESSIREAYNYQELDDQQKQ
jgi:hypothetical protein